MVLPCLFAYSVSKEKEGRGRGRGTGRERRGGVERERDNWLDFSAKIVEARRLE